jgi:4'-phosphopantetheinyl transferase
VTAVLGRDEVHIWYRRTESLDEHSISAADPTLSADEREWRDRFHFPDDRRDYTIAHDLLRRSLSRYSTVLPTQWQFTAGARGKPRIQGPELRHTLSFSLSHTRGLVACAIGSDRFVGLDVERVDRPIDVREIADRYFSPREVTALDRCRDKAQAVRFFELWTLKEAFAKAVGVGLSVPLNAMSFDLDEAGTIRFTAPPGTDATTWKFALFAPSDRMRIAAAACGRAGETLQFTSRLAEDGDTVTLAALGTTPQ